MEAPASLSIVIPCFNEEQVLPETISRVSALLDRLISARRIAENSMVYFIDDGSRDKTWSMIESLAAQNGRVGGIKLSRNQGHQNALIAGLFTVPGDAVVSIDADLQDDVNAVVAMVEKFSAGAEIVYGVRMRRDADSVFKRLTAERFYRLLTWLGVEAVHNHADYRLMSRRAIECLKQYREVNLYLRGIVPMLGFKSDIVYYDRSSRFAGESKYTLRKMISLALNAITSFSVVPLRLIALLGFVVLLGSMLVSFWILWVKFVNQNAVPGWASVLLPTYFLGGIQLFCIGILGEYLGKVYLEIKSRPRFFIETVIPEQVSSEGGRNSRAG